MLQKAGGVPGGRHSMGISVGTENVMKSLE